MKKNRILLGIILATVLMTGCKQKEIVNINPNEIAYEVNNFAFDTKDTTQKFDGSREDWSKVKSTSKMITVPYDRISTGAIPFFQTVRLPIKKIVVVSQSIVSKEWVKDVNKGSNKKDDSFSAGSSNGAEFTLGVTLSAKIKDTDTYVSIYGIDPNSSIDDVRVESVHLDRTLEKTVKPYIQGELSAEFGKLETGKIQPSKNDVITAVANRTKERFAKDGIEILTFNISGDITWHDPKIQLSINQTAQLLAERERAEAKQRVDRVEAETRRLVSEQKNMEEANRISILAEAQRVKAEHERKEQEERNKIALERAENERKISVERAKAEAEVATQKSKIVNIERELVEIEILRNKAKAVLLEKEADVVRAQKWNGVMPYSNTTIQGSQAVVDKNGEVKMINLVK